MASKSQNKPAQRQQNVQRSSQNVVSTEQIHVREVFLGPVPHPEILQGYEKVIPGAAERILMMAEQQQEHRFAREIAEQDFRHEMQRKELKYGATLAGTGQVLGFLIIMVVVMWGGFLLLQGKDLYGLAALVSGLGSLLLAYLWGKGGTEKSQEGQSEFNPESNGQ